DRILAAMRRSYTLGEYERVLAAIRARIPGVAGSTDIIVGFPGETEADFDATRAFMRGARYDSAFLFKYSARPDTRAFALPGTEADAEKGGRLAVLLEQQHRMSGEIHDESLGRTLEVLVDGPSSRGKGGGEPQLHGKSREFKTVVWADDGAEAGTLAQVK